MRRKCCICAVRKCSTFPMLATRQDGLFQEPFLCTVFVYCKIPLGDGYDGSDDCDGDAPYEAFASLASQPS